MKIWKVILKNTVFKLFSVSKLFLYSCEVNNKNLLVIAIISATVSNKVNFITVANYKRIMCTIKLKLNYVLISIQRIAQKLN